MTNLNQTQFKALAHMGVFVDYRMLDKGIYATSKPNLYEISETMDGIIFEYERAFRFLNPQQPYPTHFMQNLKRCELVNVTITIDNQDQP